MHIVVYLSLIMSFLRANANQKLSLTDIITLRFADYSVTIGTLYDFFADHDKFLFWLNSSFTGKVVFQLLQAWLRALRQAVEACGCKPRFHFSYTLTCFNKRQTDIRKFKIMNILTLRRRMWLIWKVASLLRRYLSSARVLLFYCFRCIAPFNICNKPCDTCDTSIIAR